MPYSDLVEYMHRFRAGQITRAEMGVAVALWQLSVTDWNTGLDKHAIMAS
jgi:hypothetical protein